jgi:hypothetical protein
MTEADRYGAGDGPTGRLEVFVRMLTAALAAAVTAPFGPTGSVAGAALTVLFDAAAQADRRTIQQFNKVVEQAAVDTGMSADDFQEWATRDDQHMIFVRDLVSTALSTLEEEKVRALGRLLIDALQDDTKLDDCHIVLTALATLQPVHVRVLRAMLFAANPNDPEVTAETGIILLFGRRWKWRDICDYFPQYGPKALINVLGVLEHQALITRPANEGDGTLVPTGFALLCMEYLQEAAGQEGTTDAP